MTRAQFLGPLHGFTDRIMVQDATPLSCRTVVKSEVAESSSSGMRRCFLNAQDASTPCRRLASLKHHTPHADPV
ncbi:hypothetical protein PsYK624_171790 [Phanerochaete sordida]|uniref:Uncharacterized protein n=1 Tax=Phanerochaete sordida TaxID=48140 RepID=A0A9P3GTJ3_9APHY|nr:hypothetical protein PsYK624_171790 [Phanerochaete sordida]